MPSSLTNLLPPERRRALARDYVFRLGAVALILLALLVVAHGVMLAPSYLFMQERIAIAEVRLAELSERRAVSGFEDLSARIAAFSAQADLVKNLADAPSSADAVRAVLDLPRRGILIDAFTYAAPGPDGKDGKMTVAGTAATREALRAFDASLNGLPIVESTDLPLSAYAKETDIPFTITLALAPPAP